MEQDKKVKIAFRYIISSLAINANSLGLGDENANTVLNEVFNILMNTLEPNYAESFLSELINLSDQGKKMWIQSEIEDTKRIIMEGMLNEVNRS